jgi:hypothetical protein
MRLSVVMDWNLFPQPPPRLAAKVLIFGDRGSGGYSKAGLVLQEKEGGQPVSS